MELNYPGYYRLFSCIASACPDSCCKEWDVDVDDQAASFYRTLPGPLGDRLRAVLQEGEYGTVMAIEDGRCPMWRSDGLCRIQAELGHDALCEVCRQFPRLRHDYGTFAELGLELSCPEAARLILTSPEQALHTETQPGEEAPEYDTQAMEILLDSRKALLTFLQETDMTVPQILAVTLLYAHEVQEALDGGPLPKLDPAICLADALHLAGPAEDTLKDFFLDLEILTPQWEQQLQSPAAPAAWVPEYRALLRYFICRYWLQAVADFDLLCRVKFMVIAILLIHGLGGDLISTAQLFSKEIENDPDNVEAILDGAYTCPAFTDRTLLGLLKEDIQ